ncbi:MAG: DUF2779 domain-containing protein [Candidatus Saccharimonadia bacterium]
MKWLTKSDYLKYLIHPAYLWIQKYHIDLLPEFDESAQFNVSQGNEVELEARKLFPHGILVNEEIFQKSARTQEIILQGLSDPDLTIFQASVLTSRNLFASADVLKKNGSGWDLFEVKSSSAVRTQHIQDLAFQKLAFEEAGLPITRLYIVYINRNYVLARQLDPKKLFKIENVSEQIGDIAIETADNVGDALEVLKLTEQPNDDPLYAKNFGAWLPLYRNLHPELISTSIYHLKRLTLPQLTVFRERAISDVAEIPLNMKLLAQQRAYLESLALARPAIHHQKIRYWLDQLRFPIQFLDYETYNTPIPLWSGQSPYQQLPFQYSLHILPGLDLPLVQKEYLAKGDIDPVVALLDRLETDIDRNGSVLVWFKDFEMSRNLEMAKLHPKYASLLTTINSNIFDLMEVFSNFWYVDPRFGGSVSIKNVLPALVPELTYSNLEIQKGDIAQIRWTRAVKGELSQMEADKVFADLLNYCEQDTLAMVKIYEFLRGITSPAS